MGLVYKLYRVEESDYEPAERIEISEYTSVEEAASARNALRDIQRETTDLSYVIEVWEIE